MILHKLTTVRLIKIFCLLVLMIMARQVLADCSTDAENNWQIGKICTTHFDANGNYLESWCQSLHSLWELLKGSAPGMASAKMILIVAVLTGVTLRAVTNDRIGKATRKTDESSRWIVTSISRACLIRIQDDRCTTQRGNHSHCSFYRSSFRSL